MPGSADAETGANPSREWFVGPDPDSRRAYTQALEHARDAVLDHYAGLDRAYSGALPTTLEQRFTSTDPMPEHGEALSDVLAWVGRNVLADSIAVSHPMTMAHLHCAPLVPALAAEALISAVNASMDSWDQAPAPTHFEQRIVQWLCASFGLGSHADGTFTSGGTQSNFVGLLLARDLHCRRAFGISVQQQGLPREAARLRILASNVAHFSVQQSAAILGLGHDAVVPVPVDDRQRMDAPELASSVVALRARGLVPMAVVATAGTTDFGSIDPLAAIADIAAREHLWLHVDAAYGGALVFSDRLRARLSGIAAADSIAVDFHKLFWQPISASALLVRDERAWDVLRLHADYLNPPTPDAEGMLDLVTKSIQTTRRFDALKVFVSLRTLGRRRFAQLVEHTVDVAAGIARYIAEDRFFELVTEPELNAVVFRCAGPGWPDALADAVNARMRNDLLFSGRALVGRTRVNERTCLKLTLLNPALETAALEQLIDDMKTSALRLAGGMHAA